MSVIYKDTLDMDSKKILNLADATTAQDAATLANITSAITTAAGSGLGHSAGVLSVNAGTGLEVVSDNVRIASSAAGAGLTGGGGSALDVNTGTASATGLEISSDTVRIASAGLGFGLTGGSGSAVAVNTNTVRQINGIIATHTTGNTTTTNATELILVTSASFTFVNNRAYRLSVKCLGQSTVANDSIRVRIRKGTATTGTAYLDTQHFIAPVASTNIPIYCENIIVNTSGSDVTSQMIATYARGAGTGNVLLTSSAISNLAYMEIRDIGPSSSFTGAPSIS